MNRMKHNLLSLNPIAHSTNCLIEDPDSVLLGNISEDDNVSEEIEDTGVGSSDVNFVSDKSNNRKHPGLREG